MKYITQDWTSTKDGYLFFVQRLQEMLFHYSDDIVKAPVHNTQTLLEEYVDTEKDVVKGSIKQYQLDIIAKEIKSSLMTDVIVRELYKYEVIEEMAKFLDKDQRTAVHYIFNKIPKKKYYEICCKYLKENLSESNRKTEIEKGLLLFNVRSLPPFEAFIHPPKSWSKYCGSQRERTSPSPKAFLLFTSSTKVTGEGSIRNKSLNESITHLFTCCPLEYGTHTPNTESQ